MKRKATESFPIPKENACSLYFWKSIFHFLCCKPTRKYLWVVPGSHAKGLYRSEDIDWSAEREVICNVPRGGIMLMKPLLLHASSRTTSNQRRRVIHIEFGRKPLPEGLCWSEFAGILPIKVDLPESRINR